MASRTESRARTAIDSIKKELPEASVEYLHFDLQKLASAKQAAERFIALEKRLDILVNNAGIVSLVVPVLTVPSEMARWLPHTKSTQTASKFNPATQ